MNVAAWQQHFQLGLPIIETWIAGMRRCIRVDDQLADHHCLPWVDVLLVNRRTTDIIDFPVWVNQRFHDKPTPPIFCKHPMGRGIAKTG
jgi:hypothetical protein